MDSNDADNTQPRTPEVGAVVPSSNPNSPESTGKFKNLSPNPDRNSGSYSSDTSVKTDVNALSSQNIHKQLKIFMVEEKMIKHPELSREAIETKVTAKLENYSHETKKELLERVTKVNQDIKAEIYPAKVNRSAYNSTLRSQGGLNIGGLKSHLSDSTITSSNYSGQDNSVKTAKSIDNTSQKHSVKTVANKAINKKSDISDIEE